MRPRDHESEALRDIVPASTMRGLLLLTVLAALSLGARAEAQAMTAREAFEAGVAQLDAGDVTRAAELFRTSYALDPHAGTLSSLGVALYRSGRDDVAADAFEAYLAMADRDDARDEQVRGALAEIQRRVGRVTLSDAPMTGVVRVDGAPRLLGARIVHLTSGPHRLEVELPDGRDPFTRSISVPVGADVDVSDEIVRARETLPPGAIDEEAAWIGSSIGALGLAAILVAPSIVLGLDAQAQWSATVAQCPGLVCTNESGIALAGRAGQSADASTGLAITAGIVATVGIVLLAVTLSD